MAQKRDDKVKIFTVRVVDDKEYHIHTSSGDVTNQKYLPIIPISMDADTKTVLLTTVFKSAVDGRLPALQMAIKHKMFANKDVQSYLQGEIEALAAKQKDALEREKRKVERATAKEAKSKSNVAKELRETVESGAGARA